jgi:hypothetical protein
MRKIVFLSSLILFLNSCTISAYYIQEDFSTYSQTIPSEVKIITTDVDEDYKVIGSIAVAADGNNKRIKLFLQEKAADLGADAVIFVRLNKMTSSDSYIGLSGVAIKFQ